MDIQENSCHSYSDGSSYEGDFLCGKRHGFGKLTSPSKTNYVGQFQKGLPHGLGIMTMKSGVEYHGQFENGRFHGKGMFLHKNGYMFKGQFWEGRVEGYGSYTTDKETIFCEGLFEDGKLVSQADCTETSSRVNAVVQQAHILVESISSTE